MGKEGGNTQGEQITDNTGEHKRCDNGVRKLLKQADDKNTRMMDVHLFRQLSCNFFKLS